MKPSDGSELSRALGPCAKATHEINDKGDQQNQSEGATAKGGTTEIETTATEEEQENE